MVSKKQICMVNTLYNFYPLKFVVDFTSSLLTPSTNPLLKIPHSPDTSFIQLFTNCTSQTISIVYNPVFASQNKANQGHSGQQRAGENLDRNRTWCKHTLLRGVSTEGLCYFQPYSPSSQGIPPHLRFVEHLCLAEHRAHHSYASLKASVPSSCLRDDSQHR